MREPWDEVVKFTFSAEHSLLNFWMLQASGLPPSLVTALRYCYHCVTENKWSLLLVVHYYIWTCANSHLSKRPLFLSWQTNNPYIDFYLNLFNGHLFVTATFFCPQGGRCGEVQLYFDLVTYRLNFFKGIPHPWRVWATSSCIWQITASTRRMKELISQTLMKLFARDTNGISFLVTSLSVYSCNAATCTAQRLWLIKNSWQYRISTKLIIHKCLLFLSFKTFHFVVKKSEKKEEEIDLKVRITTCRQS